MFSFFVTFAIPMVNQTKGILGEIYFSSSDCTMTMEQLGLHGLLS